jgi:opacity protein-like surface antigen
MKRLLAAAAASLVLSSIAHAAALTQTVTNIRKECEAKVPADWKDGGPGMGWAAPGGRGSITVSASPLSLADGKKMTTSIFPATKVFEDTAKRYWIEFKPSQGGATHNYYVLLPQGGTLCALDLEWNTALSDADARAIVDSLKKH